MNNKNMSIPINQHYVPQFLLRNFKVLTSNNKVQINIFDKKSGKFKLYQSIKNVYSEDHFYGESSQTENELGIVETKASNIIKKIIDKNDYHISDSEYNVLVQFISSQYSRTLKMRESMLKLIDDRQMHIVKSLFDMNKNKAPFKELYDKSANVDYGHFEYKEEHLRMISNANAITGIQLSHMISDLSIHILENNTKEEFIIGDQPVILCNWLLSSYQLTKNIPINSSPLAMGAQLFMPLSPKLYLCLYDATIYKYGSKSKTVTNINVENVRWLNKLQLIYASDIIGFSTEQMQSSIFMLQQQSKNIHLEKRLNLGNKNYQLGGYVLKNLEPKPNFFKILDKAKSMPNRAITDDPFSSNKLIAAKFLYRNNNLL